MTEMGQGDVFKCVVTLLYTVNHEALYLYLPISFSVSLINENITIPTPY